MPNNPLNKLFLCFGCEVRNECPLLEHFQKVAVSSVRESRYADGTLYDQINDKEYASSLKNSAGVLTKKSIYVKCHYKSNQAGSSAVIS